MWGNLSSIAYSFSQDLQSFPQLTYTFSTVPVHPSRLVFSYWSYASNQNRILDLLDEVVQEV